MNRIVPFKLCLKGKLSNEVRVDIHKKKTTSYNKPTYLYHHHQEAHTPTV